MEFFSINIVIFVVKVCRRSNISLRSKRQYTYFNEFSILTAFLSPHPVLVWSSTSCLINAPKWNLMVLTGWYVVPSTEHYRCQKCYIPRTFGIRNDLTVDWFPHSVTFPKVTTGEYLYQTATGMLILIQGTMEHPIDSLTYVLPLTNVHIQFVW